MTQKVARSNLQEILSHPQTPKSSHDRQGVKNTPVNSGGDVLSRLQQAEARRERLHAGFGVSFVIRTCRS